uniref:DNA polymerase III subunit alpha n=1 Tax=uncultured Nitrospirae bacterium Rifle_16ft_4_minimus_4901 TaxID=1665132 RepID=A0A0H4TCT0_9BACT|nr:polymerase III subunit alpha, DNA polymerase III subunit alpha protein [uncultured Nitrospirae bacterium Rifle_16ft_4_minimus_4901]
MQHSDFVHLHFHTKYSLLDGANTIEAVVDTADRYKMPALAITDHGNMFGVIEFYQAAMKKGIKPIIGCEAYIAPKGRLDKKDNYGIPNASFHIVLLASSNIGYKNLIKLVSEAHLEGFYYRPRIDKELLAQHSEGLICLSSCLKGEVPYRLLEGREEDAIKAAGEYIDIFGRDNFYFEIQDNKIKDQEKINRDLIRLSKKLGVQVVATGDCHYLKRENARAHEILLCIQTGSNINDPHRLRFSTDEFYMKSPEEMHRAFSEIPEAILNSREIAKKCNVELQFGRFFLPEYDVPEGFTKESFVERLAFKGLEERFPEGAAPVAASSVPKSEYEARLKEELSVINRMGYAGYFLIVWDFINYAKANAIPVGPGRGSAAGSLVAYCLRITDLNPIKYGLLFERFLNPERISMPDIDIDFCMDKRDRVIQYVTGKYGSDHVAQIITFGTMAARGVIRDVGRSLDIPYSEVDRVAKLIPEGPNVKLEDALSSEPKLKELMNADSRIKTLIEYALSLEGLTRHASTHAAGIVISKEPLTEYVPLSRGTKDEVVTQFAMEDIEKIGLVKFDFLGLKTLTVIDHTVRLINSTTQEDDNERFDIVSIPLDDLATYELFSSGNTTGIFQLESSGMRDILVKIKPDKFEDLIAILALYRPGPLGSGMVDDYVKRRRGLIPVKYETPEIKDILKETHGVIVYQEQVMKIANVLAGFSMGEADILRRAMGKKDPETMTNLKERFKEGAKQKNINSKKAEKIFDLIEYFAGYGFNKSHSAAYALISYQTAYLKVHYPVEYMAAMLTCEMGKMDKVTAGIRECKDMGIDVLPPDVNESEKDFTVTGKSIRFGLVAIKNVGESAIESIIATRRESGNFKSVFDFCKRVDLRKVNKRTIESLIKCGAFDSMGIHRSRHMDVIDKAISFGGSYQKSKNQVSIFDTLTPEDQGNPSGLIPNIDEWDEHILLKNEKETIGFYITGHPLARFEAVIKKHSQITTKDIAELDDGKEVVICGIITEIKTTLTKKGDKMAYARIEDMDGFAEVIIFPDTYKASSDILAEDKPVIIIGSINKSDAGFKIKSSKIQDLLTAPVKKDTRVDIRLHSVGLTQDDLKALKGILKEHSGAYPVYIHIISNQKEYILALDNSMRINPSNNLITAVETRFGKNSILFN